MTLKQQKHPGLSDIGFVSFPGLAVSSRTTVSIQTWPRDSFLGRLFHSAPRAPDSKRYATPLMRTYGWCEDIKASKPGFWHWALSFRFTFISLLVCSFVCSSCGLLQNNSQRLLSPRLQTLQNLQQSSSSSRYWLQLLVVRVCAPAYQHGKGLTPLSADLCFRISLYGSLSSRFSLLSMSFKPKHANLKAVLGRVCVINLDKSVISRKVCVINLDST